MTGRCVERARWLRHASAFVGAVERAVMAGLGGGLPVVLISGFTHPDQRVQDSRTG